MKSFKCCLNLLLFLLPLKVWSCPFCELGGSDVAFFIISILGMFILAMSFIFFAFIKSGGLKNSDRLSKKAIEVEQGVSNGK